MSVSMMNVPILSAVGSTWRKQRRPPVLTGIDMIRTPGLAARFLSGHRMPEKTILLTIDGLA
jgi:hypothetical protein